MLKAYNFAKIRFMTDVLIIICRKFSEQILLRTPTYGRLMFRQSTDQYFKLKWLINFIPSLLAVSEISPFKLQELFETRVNGFNLTLIDAF